MPANRIEREEPFHPRDRSEIIPVLELALVLASLWRRSEEPCQFHQSTSQRIPNWGAKSPKIENEHDDEHENDWKGTPATRDASAKDG